MGKISHWERSFLYYNGGNITTRWERSGGLSLGELLGGIDVALPTCGIY